MVALIDIVLIKQKRVYTNAKTERILIIIFKLRVRSLVVSDLQSETKGFIAVTTYVQK